VGCHPSGGGRGGRRFGPLWGAAAGGPGPGTGPPARPCGRRALPFRSETFDLVFCDHGALSWSDPTYSVSEATRVLVPGGRLVFNTASPWLRVCFEGSSDRITAGLHHSYFELGALDEGDGAKTYTLTYGAWIRVFRANGLVVEDLIEPRPPLPST
jgi:SAM-dependent methyltransferase